MWCSSWYALCDIILLLNTTAVTAIFAAQQGSWSWLWSFASLNVRLNNIMAEWSFNGSLHGSQGGHGDETWKLYWHPRWLASQPALLCSYYTLFYSPVLWCYPIAHNRSLCVEPPHLSPPWLWIVYHAALFFCWCLAKVETLNWNLGGDFYSETKYKCATISHNDIQLSSNNINTYYY